ncbi:hypothetical protein [Deinococcus yavapaiensis]|nr:hypothetical protein [Deinococcus yavapaiensis]
MKYRWLTVGETYAYRAALGRGLDERRGQSCTILTLPKPGTRPANVRVRFEDGVVHIVPSGVLKAIGHGGS